MIFNLDFVDKVPWKKVNGNLYYMSEELEKLWQKGHTMIGEATFESAAYVARYITKKITGPRAEEHYNLTCPHTGQVIHERKPEYATMSQGIGRGWYEKYKSDLNGDFAIMNGRKVEIPRFYDSLLEAESSLVMARVKAKRKVKASKHEENCTPDRMRVRKEVQYARLDKLHRSIEK